MGDFYEGAGLLAGVLAIAGHIPYILAILKKTTKPSIAGWSIWAIVDILTLLSYYLSGARQTLFVPISFTIGTSIIAGLALFYGQKGWNKGDLICLIGAAITALIWFFSSNSSVRILVLSLILSFLGAIPIIKKAYLDPKSENKWAWALFLLSGITNLIAVKHWVFGIAVYPVCIFLMDGVIAFLVLKPRS